MSGLFEIVQTNVVPDRPTPPKMDWFALQGVDWTLGVEPLPWGTYVRYHHLVAVVRGKGGPSKETIYPPVDTEEMFGDGKPGWWHWRKDYKGLWIWPEDGEAIVLGWKRKMIGYINAGGGYSSYSGDYDPPSFEFRATVPLLLLSLKDSMEFAYAPFWAVEPTDYVS